MGWLIAVFIVIAIWLVLYVASHERSARDHDRIARSLQARFEQQEKENE